jgi:hypothetical protein
MVSESIPLVLHFGAAPPTAVGGTAVPTRHPRISVTNDPLLDEAITRARLWLNGAPDATIVHDLAIRGAEAMAQDEGLRRTALERLAELATDPDSDLDREALLTVRTTAWRV